MTRKLVVCNLISLDGYHEAPDKTVLPLFDGKLPVSPRFIDTRTWHGAGIVLVRYDVRRKAN